MFLLWHPSLTAINLSYTFLILETSATALCGTTGICIYVCACVQTSCLLSRFFAVFWNLCPVQLRFDRGNFCWKLEAELRIQIWYVFSWTFGFVVAFMVLMAQLGTTCASWRSKFLRIDMTFAFWHSIWCWPYPSEQGLQMRDLLSSGSVRSLQRFTLGTSLSLRSWSNPVFFSFFAFWF